MSTAAVMVVRDEADVIRPVVEHVLAHVDEVLVVDHRSVDGTREILEGMPVVLETLDERGLHGDLVWTRLAHLALERGHDWVLVNDADDAFHVADDPDQRIADYLAGVADEVLAVGADSYNHVPTAAADAAEGNVLVRMGWREVVPDARKVACRLRGDFSYARHNGWYGGELAPHLIYRGLEVRHFTIRSADQLVRKVRNGMDAASVDAGMPVGYDESWEQWQGLSDGEIRDRFWDDFWSADPRSDQALVYDPAPVRP